MLIFIIVIPAKHILRERRAGIQKAIAQEVLKRPFFMFLAIPLNALAHRPVENLEKLASKSNMRGRMPIAGRRADEPAQFSL